MGAHIGFSEAIDDKQSIHNNTYLPIHKYIQNIIPYLEQRQEVCKKFTGILGKDANIDKQFEDLVEHINKELCKILNIK